MTQALDDFLGFAVRSNPRFRMTVPKETSYEEMVRKYEAGDKRAHETMQLLLPMRPGDSAADELARWKDYARVERAALRAEAPVSHSLAGRPSRDDLATLETQLDGASPALLALYQQHDGAALFVAGDGQGLFFLPIDAMADELGEILAWYEDDDQDATGEEAEDEGAADDGELFITGLPDWFDTALVFGAIDQAAERFLLPVSGPHRGAVFIFEHDPLGMRRLDTSFEGFLHWLVTEPQQAGELCGIYDTKTYLTDS